MKLIIVIFQEPLRERKKMLNPNVLVIILISFSETQIGHSGTTAKY